MSGKRARFFRKRRIVSKKLIACTLVMALTLMPMPAQGDISVTIFPHFIKPISLGETHDINNGYGAGLKLSYAPNKYMDIFIEGDYLNLNLPNVDPITVMNGNIGLGYKIPVSDRINIGVSAEAGGYKASHKADMTGVTGAASLSLSYKFGPTVSSETKTTVNHYSAGDTPLITGAMVSPGLSVNLTEAFQNKTKIRVNTKSIYPVFPVLHSWYNDNPFAKIEVKNEEDFDIEQVSVSFFQPLYMAQPKVLETKDKVKKGDSFETEITAFFNERMLDLIEKTDTQATITIKYLCLGKEKSYSYPVTIPVYDRNSMSWEDDRRAAAFVSSKDPAALWYAKYISSIVHDNMRNGVAQNIQYAMGIFETLDRFGLNYVIDPSSSYADNIGTASIDFLQFPYQTLMYRGGDCDDISILVCSLFEAVGIETAFITIPGHIFMAFNSGLTLAEAKKEFSSMENFIVNNDEVWVPLEITLTDEGFNKAWKVGAREWKQAEKNNAACLYKMKDSWKIYKPVSVPGAAIKFTMLENDKIEDAFESSIVTWINHEIAPMANEYKSAIAQTDSDETINSLGALYARYGLFVKADEQFKKSRRRGYLPSILNTANMYFTTKDYTLALKWYKKVLEIEADNMLATLGLARCCYELELYDECDEAYERLRKESPKLAANYSYLGAFENRNGRSFSLSDRLGKTIWVNDFLDFHEYDKESLAISDSEANDSGGIPSAADLIPPEELLASLPQGLLRPDAEVPDNKADIVINNEPKKKAKTPEDFGSERFVGLINEIAIKNPENQTQEKSGTSDFQMNLALPEVQVAEKAKEEKSNTFYLGKALELETPNPNVYESFDAVAALQEESGNFSEEKLFISIPITNPSKEENENIDNFIDESLIEPVTEEDYSPVPVPERELTLAPHRKEKPEEIIGLSPEIEKLTSANGGKKDSGPEKESEERETLPDLQILEEAQLTLDSEFPLLLPDAPSKKAAEKTELTLAPHRKEKPEEIISLRADDIEKLISKDDGKSDEIPQPLIFDESEAKTSLAPEPETFTPMEIPRFTRPPSADWAPEESYTASFIPGMKPFEEEMEITVAKDNTTNKLSKIAPDEDFETVSEKVEKEEIPNEFLKTTLQENDSGSSSEKKSEGKKYPSKDSQKNIEAKLKKSERLISVKKSPEKPKETKAGLFNKADGPKEISPLTAIDKIWDEITGETKNQKNLEKTNQKILYSEEKEEKSVLETLDKIWDGFTKNENKDLDQGEKASLAFVLLASGVSSLAALLFLILLLRRRKEKNGEDK